VVQHNQHWPTKSFYRGQGVKLADLLELAGGLNENATQIKFTASDGFSATFTVEELLNESRYKFPNFIDYGLPAPDRYFLAVFLRQSQRR
jgi:DMSO/TMAO reductase YedYZ molybdopterin-dependent catalytic subunit